MNILGELVKRFGEYYLDTDILIIDKEEFSMRKNYVGFMEYWANKEGIIL